MKRDTIKALVIALAFAGFICCSYLLGYSNGFKQSRVVFNTMLNEAVRKSDSIDVEVDKIVDSVLVIGKELIAEKEKFYKEKNRK